MISAKHPTRGVGYLLFVAAVVMAIAAVTLVPHSWASPLRAEFVRLLQSAGEPLFALMPDGGTDRLINALLYIPLGAAIGIILPRRAWPVGIALGFVLSATIECTQRSVPGRVADVDDVLWNTIGTAIGLVVLIVVRALFDRVGAGRRRSTPTRAVSAGEVDAHVKSSARHRRDG